MKRVLEIDNRRPVVYGAKSRDKMIRSRNKRKCKRKKSVRNSAKRVCYRASATSGESPGIRIPIILQPTNVTPATHVQVRKHQPPCETSAATAAIPQVVPRAQALWARTYNRIVKWHSKHQLNYWKLYAQRLRVENARLRQLRQTTTSLTTRYANEEEPTTSSDSEAERLYHPTNKDDPYGDTDDESANGDGLRAHTKMHRPVAAVVAAAATEEEEAGEPEWDEEFLAFMEVSARHRLERSRLKNESVH
ncbi:uncharacterized protein LOC118457504 isoform X2 [Anopheles albimanus]|uniref:uncharacterized protein LOC118457504 isoform X2 n=1 Tax=Anopheles albimanus TaxID=7167 RepID=UPI0016410059|nr:uncharacterized protein LOC118457504 isoform X2 [Anopheles albimanus]